VSASAGHHTHRHGLPVTTLPRTLLDCAPTLSDRGLTRAVNDARIARLCTPEALADVLLGKVDAFEQGLALSEQNRRDGEVYLVK